MEGDAKDDVDHIGELGCEISVTEQVLGEEQTAKKPGRGPGEIWR